MTPSARSVATQETAARWRRASGRSTGAPTAEPDAEYYTRLRAARGDRHAWTQLVDAHLATLWSWAVAQTTDAADAAAVCEIVWLRLADALPGSEQQPLSSWLSRTVNVEAARLRRQPARHLQRLPEQATGGAPVLRLASEGGARSAG